MEVKNFDDVMKLSTFMDVRTEIEKCMSNVGVTSDEDEIYKLIDHAKSLRSDGEIYNIFGSHWYKGIKHYWVDKTYNTVEINLEKAFQMFKKGVEHNEREAMIKLAFMFWRGDFVEKNLNETKRFFEMAINVRSDGRVLDFLGSLFLDENFAEYDVKKAITYLEEGISMGGSLTGAYCGITLGELFEKGTKIEQDYEKALLYYATSSCLGNALGTDNYERLHKLVKLDILKNDTTYTSKIYLELIDAASSKFWKVEWTDTSYKVSFGKIGSKVTIVKHMTPNAEQEARVKSKGKIKKGYVEVNEAN